MVINSVLNLMKMSHMDAQNSTVFVFANVDKPYFKLEWIFEKLPKNIKAKFDCYKTLKTFLFRNSRTFLIIGGFIQLRTKLVDIPCDKSISLEILKIQHQLTSPSIQVIHSLEYLNKYFDFHVCLSFRRPSAVHPCVRKLAPFPAVVSQNVTNKSCLVCV